MYNEWVPEKEPIFNAYIYAKIINTNSQITKIYV